ncbi:MAG: O-succinylhomoserine sulfhydrylase [Neisseria sp.]|nr:O-succinylhomoserine sulfhydrylase [Neisseria sp.]
MTSPLHPETLAIRGARAGSGYGEHSQALFLTSSFTYDTAEEARALFLGETEGFTYTRTANPTVSAFAARMAQLEKAESGVATASGMAAIQATLMALLQAGDHVVTSKSLFGTTIGLLNTLPAYGIEVTFVAQTDVSAWQAAMRPNTKMLLLETPSNPLGEIADIVALAQMAHAAGALLAVDNCFCSPALQQPIALGADLSIQSATKAIDGQGRVMGGAVCGSAALIEIIFKHVRTAGQIMSPFNAWVLLSGLETLYVRMEKQCANALILAQWLQTCPQVEAVYYPGLPEHPQAELVRQQQSAGGIVVTFAVKGGQAEAWQVVDALNIFSRTGNLGDVKSTVTHPFTTTHARVEPAEKIATGITPNLLRLSIGLEHIDDLRADLQQALDQL